MADDTCGETRYSYDVFYFWTRRNNAPAVLNEVEGYPKHFDTKEEALEWIKHDMDTNHNVNITWCIAPHNEWALEELKKLYEKVSN